ncbi:MULTISPECIES: glycosyltransferase family 2 protein [unclassified Mucilaginibacter]|uniref:glycosyltransferase family 2 protein n=1 Tax=unclassified Mucilaginibacter TaxID=2617802 RepID=UPI002AC96E2D|nr:MULTISPECIES: glycosyltransferase family 2 protein [unclassified Mucilaginibacter]MEB0260409.1 glycosyltransferase family 2 protein [Mucilaginibacter sp. 10I4]MEB0279448.1 glycosyltransferase family 2 protein [Mucilaginibacter sp. 10B2]MEB0300009.1 glycosyltransferase family 2 protein [Mucilaginibacter sp. 5C4]WPX21822.1 glycosyltransferase family 2 protein [Mucilaginibacter sp. 5C4]
MDISVVVPLYDEVESLPELTSWISRVMADNNYTYEIILVDDGSKDGSWDMIVKLKENNPFIKAFKFRRNYGKSAALNIGFEAAHGDVVITMDADLQDSPDEIPVLYRRITEDKYDLVSGWKAKRYDPLTKTIPTKLFNAATRKMSGIDNLHDFNCGLKAYRKAVVKNIEVYGEMHRYIPVIAKWAGFTKIGEQVVEHRARKYGKTKFGWTRFINGFLDLLSIFFVGKFGKRPMHFFGAMGTLSFFAGIVITIWMLSEKLYLIAHKLPYRNVTENPLFYIALVAMILGSQLFLTGFVAELVSRNSHDRNNYQIEDTI